MSEIVDISALKPGPEMDAEVGRHIGATPQIKWYAMNKEETAYYSDFERKSEAEDWHNDMITRRPNSWYVADGGHIVRKEIYPRYSMDISAAWQLVERLKQNYWVQVIRSSSGAACEVGEYGSSDAIAKRRGKEAPEAICRLVLMVDMKKPSAPTESPKEISQVDCIIDISKVEPLVDRAWAEEILRNER